MIYVYPNNVTLQSNPGLYETVSRRTGCVPVMCKFADSPIDHPAIEAARRMAASLDLPIVAAVAPPLARGRELLVNATAWRAYLAEVRASVEMLISGTAPIAAVLVDQECWSVAQFPAPVVAGRTNDLACALMSACGCPVWFYRFGDQQAKHFSTYNTRGPVLEDFRLPVSARCYEPTRNNERDFRRVDEDDRYAGRMRGAWFASAGGYGYVNGQWSNANEHRDELIARAKTDGALAAELTESGLLHQVIVYPHPTSLQFAGMDCFRTFADVMGLPH